MRAILRAILKPVPQGANAVTKGILFETLRRPRAEALDFASRGFASACSALKGWKGVPAFVESVKLIGMKSYRLIGYKH